MERASRGWRRATVFVAPIGAIEQARPVTEERTRPVRGFQGHGFARPENNIAFTAVMEAFLATHLGGAYQPVGQAELAASSMQIRDGRDGIPWL